MVYTVLLPKIKIGNSGEKQGIKILPLFPLKIFILVSLLPDMTAYNALLCLKVIDCDPMDCSPPGSSVHRILQIRILEWVAMPPPGELTDPGIQLVSLMTNLQWQTYTSTFWEAQAFLRFSAGKLSKLHTYR